MYRAAHAYRATDATALTIQEGEQFTLLEKTDEHWWQVMNNLGQTGYVPASYLEKDSAPRDDVVASIDRAIEFIHLATTEKPVSPEQRENLKKLAQHRQSVLQGKGESLPHVASGQQPKRKAPELPRQSSTDHRKAPPPPSDNTQSTSPTSPDASAGRSSRSSRASTKSRAAPRPPQRNESINKGQEIPASSQDQTDSRISDSNKSQPSTSTPQQSRTAQSTRSGDLSPVSSTCMSPSHGHKQSTLSSPSRPVVPKGLLGELVEMVRVETNLSYDMSKMAIKTVLLGVGHAVPDVASTMGAILSSLQTDLNVTSSNIIIEGSRDHERLEVIFSELTACKDDAQQRSWALHEDEAVITEYLEELITILTDADPRVCKAVVTSNNFEYIQNLVLYYQMEHRPSLRLLLLKVFGALCGLNRDALSSLLCSVLPVELAQDLRTNREHIPKLCYSSLVCTMLLSTGEQIPFTHYDQFNADFIHYLLDSIDSPPDTDDMDQIPDLFVNLILAFNLHLRVPAENIVMNVLAEKGTAKGFSERIMLLVNRGVDPVKMFEHSRDAQDSLLKLMADIFSCPTTSDLFYSNDMKVLIDIIVRQVTDLNPGDQVRTENLSLIYSIFKNTSYWEDCHRLQELERVFVAIAMEEGQESEQDQLIVREIKQDFESKFSKSF